MTAHDLENSTNDNLAGAGVGSPILRIPHKLLDKPPRPKPTYASDEECARLLATALRQVPRELVGDDHSRFPLLDALKTVARTSETDVAREIVFIAAVNHRAADERRTAEYLLRNREDVLDGRRSPKSLLLAARCAAELDVRRDRLRNASLPRQNEGPSTADVWLRAQSRSAGDIVLEALRVVVGPEVVTQDVENRLIDAVTVALELAERHALKRGRGSAVLAMRTDARPQARLVTHLRQEFDDGIARNLARLIVGPDGSPIETALLWWSVRPNLTAEQVPAVVRARWRRYLRAVAATEFRATSYPQANDTTWTPKLRVSTTPITGEQREAPAFPDGPPLVTRGPNERHPVIVLTGRTLRNERAAVRVEP